MCVAGVEQQGTVSQQARTFEVQLSAAKDKAKDHGVVQLLLSFVSSSEDYVRKPPPPLSREDYVLKPPRPCALDHPVWCTVAGVCSGPA